MELSVILANIERRLAVLNLSADEAGRLAGRPDAIRNIRRKVRSKARGSIKADTLGALAEALQTTTAELLRPPAGATAPPAPGMREFLLQQRALIDEQLASLDAAELSTGKRVRQRRAGNR